jgi:hypothetical protein
MNGRHVSALGRSLVFMDLGSLPPQLRPLLTALAAALHNREPAIRERVTRLQAENPSLSPDQLAKLLLRQTRRRVAATGALSGATAIVPGLGTLVAIGAVTGQTLYALEQETELVLAIGMIYGHELAGSDARLLEALAVVGIAGGGVKLRDDVLVAGGQQITVAAFRRVPEAFMARAGGHVAGRVLGRLAATRAARSAVRLAPLAAGVAAGAGFDWLAVSALGRAAARYYGPGGPAARRMIALPDREEVESGT